MRVTMGLQDPLPFYPDVIRGRPRSRLIYKAERDIFGRAEAGLRRSSGEIGT